MPAEKDTRDTQRLVGRLAVEASASSCEYSSSEYYCATTWAISLASDALLAQSTRRVATRVVASSSNCYCANTCAALPARIRREARDASQEARNASQDDSAGNTEHVITEMRAAKCEKTTTTRDAIETKPSALEDGMVAAVAAGSGVKKQPEKRMASLESVLSQSATPILLSHSGTPRLEAGSCIFAECKYTGKRKPSEGSSESADRFGRAWRT